MAAIGSVRVEVKPDYTAWLESVITVLVVAGWDNTAIHLAVDGAIKAARAARPE